MNIPVKLAGYLAIGIFAVCCIVFLWSLIFCILKIKNTKLENKKFTVLISLGCVFVAAVSWLFNIGWLRFVLTLFVVPFIHAAVFVSVNMVAVSFFKYSKYLKITNLLFCITYLLMYVLYPDSGNADMVYCFFGLVNNPAVVSVVQKIADIMVILHVVLFVAQLVMVGMVKNISDEDKTAEAVEETEEAEEHEEKIEE